MKHWWIRNNKGFVLKFPSEDDYDYKLNNNGTK